MDNDIYKVVLGTLIRHFLSIVAGSLAPYGVNEAMQGQLVEATVVLTVSAVLAIGMIVWSWFQKRLAAEISKQALKAAPNTPMDIVELKAAEKISGTKF